MLISRKKKSLSTFFRYFTNPMTLYTAAFVGYQYLNIECCNGEILKIMTSYTIFVRKSIKLLPLKPKKVLHLLKNSQIKTGIIYIYIYIYIIYIYIEISDIYHNNHRS